MFGFFGRKKEIEDIKREISSSFSHVKNDFEKVSEWINHLNSSKEDVNSRLNSLYEDMSTIKEDIEQLKDVISMFGDGVSKQLFKTDRSVFNKQTVVEPVQTVVQTPVQTGKFYGFSNLSVTERAIVWILANHELKLSYEDLAAMLGKRKSTIRGQINSIKQKSEGLVEEYTEKSGKKRVYIPEEIKEKILKKVKVSVKRRQKGEK